MLSQDNVGHSRFLVQCRPLLEESLSSFRQRVGWANGYSLFPILDERRRRIDPDRSVRDDDLQWLVAANDLEPEAISKMIFDGIALKMNPPPREGLHPPWWIRARYPANARPFGPMYCALCLKTDEVPFFRLFWRLGFVTHCPVHRTQLEDQCSECLSAPWPRGSGARETMSKNFLDFRKCWRCGIELAAKRKNQEGSFGKWRSWLESGTADLGNQIVHYTEAFMALRAICQLFLRNRCRSQILKYPNQWAVQALSMSADALRTQAIEQCSVADRARIVSAAAELLEDWPSQFLNFAKVCGLQREHFSGSYQLMPSWMQNVVDSQLARQNRWVTSTVLCETISSLTVELGRAPSQTAVRQRLQWSGEKGLSAHFQKRKIATIDEWKKFLFAVNLMSQAVCGEPRSYRAFLIDLNILFYGMSNQLSIAACRTVTLRTAFDFNVQLALKSSSSDGKPLLIRSFLDTNGVYSPDREKWLESTASTRQVRKRLTALMKNCPPDLHRVMLVFSVVSSQS